MSTGSVVIDRFLTPAHAAADSDIDQWHIEAGQYTSGNGVWCWLLVQPVYAHSYRARFLAYGPPAVIAAAAADHEVAVLKAVVLCGGDGVGLSYLQLL